MTLHTSNYYLIGSTTWSPVRRIMPDSRPPRIPEELVLIAIASTVTALNPLDPHSLLTSFGTLGVFVVLFAETGLLIGFFLPGDSLLFTAGLLAATSSGSQLHLSIWAVLIAAAAGALLGAETGYLIGRKAGPALLDRPDRPRLQEATARAAQVITRYGEGKAIVLARFIPVVRTVLNPLAGAIGVPTATFTFWQVIGGLGWSVGVTLAGFVLGSHVPNIDRYLLPIVAVVVVSLAPIALEFRRKSPTVDNMKCRDCTA